LSIVLKEKGKINKSWKELFKIIEILQALNEESVFLKRHYLIEINWEGKEEKAVFYDCPFHRKIFIRELKQKI